MNVAGFVHRGLQMILSVPHILLVLGRFLFFQANSLIAFFRVVSSPGIIGLHGFLGRFLDDEKLDLSRSLASLEQDVATMELSNFCQPHLLLYAIILTY